MNMHSSFNNHSGATFAHNVLHTLRKTFSGFLGNHSEEIQAVGNSRVASFGDQAVMNALTSPREALSTNEADLSKVRAQVVIDSANWTGGKEYNGFIKPDVEITGTVERGHSRIIKAPYSSKFSAPAYTPNWNWK